MKRKLFLVMTWVLISGFAAIQAQAQKGVGDPVGIAQQAVKPEVVSLSGTLKAITNEPCEMTTGRSVTGTHILLGTAEEDQWNVHLGPTASVAHVAAKLVVGQDVAVQAFRTDKLRKDNYVAQSLKTGDVTIRLRDENLRPVWASGRATPKGRGGSQQALGNGKGPGSRAANGRGQGQNRDVARGPRRGQGCCQGQGRGGGKGRGQGQGFGRGQCRQCEQQLGAIVDSLPKRALSEKEREGLLLMREEEKLAHDVYVTLGKKWELRPFANIPQAESRHMDFIKMLLDRYDIVDPIDHLAVGKFPSHPMQQLYNQLVAQGEKSIEEAIKVGALIEELDIADLRRLTDDADNDDIKVVYQNLLKGSRNHLRAFALQLSRYNTTYAAKHLSQVEFDRIAGSNHERGVMIRDPNYKF